MRHQTCFAFTDDFGLVRCNGTVAEWIADQAYCPYHAEALRRATGGQLVYFAERDGLIKIGVAHDPHARAASLRARLLAVKPGGRPLEMQLHDEFVDSRVRGEWFADTAALRAYIKSQAVAA